MHTHTHTTHPHTRTPTHTHTHTHTSLWLLGSGQWAPSYLQRRFGVGLEEADLMFGAVAVLTGMYVHRPRVRRRCWHYWPYISRLCTSLCLYSLRHIHWHTWHGELMLRCAWLLQVSSVSHPCCIACISCMFCAGCARVLCWSSVGGMHVFCMWLVHVCCVACACYHMPMCCACLAYALRGVSP